MMRNKVYIDDSQMGQSPVSVLGGWLHDERQWALFSDEWKQALDMSPRLAYFKYSEARTLSGEFAGWSERSRDERVRLLMRILRDHKPVGVASAMPHDLYQKVFGKNPDKVIRHPYFFSFFGVVAGVSQALARTGRIEPVEFIFDSQPDQMDAVTESWKSLVRSAPDDIRPMLGGYPIFRSDKTTMPLQAADLCAGYQREIATDTILGRKSLPPMWGDLDLTSLTIIGRFWNADALNGLYENWLAKQGMAVPP
ncbi:MULTISPECIES: hypothetical protein [unclassified Bradyrhizobium]|uniref:hypothetical protein n=1 Tax=unclassified Bradyrhizobium TaxID=2631580 RepID=UPI0029160CF6|nr:MULTISPECIES: hypothetical protein [unclassified Bradyrhizobium]